MKSDVLNGVWAVYLLQKEGAALAHDCGRGNRDLYVGISNRVNERLKSHAEGKNRSTKGATWKLRGTIPCRNRTEAALLERWLKVGNSRQKRWDFINACESGTEYRPVAIARLILRAKIWDTNRSLRRNFGEAAITATIGATKDTEGEGNANW